MRWIAGLIGGLWNISRRSWVDVGGGLRPGSPAAGLYLFLVLIFFLIGLALMLLGFDLEAVDRWLDARADWFELIGTVIFKALLAVILLFCAVIIGAGLYERVVPGKGKREFGLGLMIGALVAGYFVWVGLVNPL